jgi:hypothetical protein
MMDAKAHWFFITFGIKFYGAVGMPVCMNDQMTMIRSAIYQVEGCRYITKRIRSFKKRNGSAGREEKCQSQKGEYSSVHKSCPRCGIASKFACFQKCEHNADQSN